MSGFIISGGLCDGRYYCVKCDELMSPDDWRENGGLCPACTPKHCEFCNKEVAPDELMDWNGFEACEECCEFYTNEKIEE